jgi:hypothetical protein
MRPHEPSIINQLQLYCPPCSKCGAPTQLARIEQGDEPDYDLRTYECTSCAHAKVIKVKFR